MLQVASESTFIDAITTHLFWNFDHQFGLESNKTAISVNLYRIAERSACAVGVACYSCG